MRFVASLTIGTALLVSAGTASAARLRAFHPPAVVCAPSLEQVQMASSDAIQHLCLLRLSPLFERASIDLTPRATKKRWFAELELRF